MHPCIKAVTVNSTKVAALTLIDVTLAIRLDCDQREGCHFLIFFHGCYSGVVEEAGRDYHWDGKGGAVQDL